MGDRRADTLLNLSAVRSEMGQHDVGLRLAREAVDLLREEMQVAAQDFAHRRERQHGLPAAMSVVVRDATLHLNERLTVQRWRIG